LALITEGTTEKVSQITVLFRSIYNKNIFFNGQNCIFENQSLREKEREIEKETESEKEGERDGKRCKIWLLYFYF
jgi:hypothetical protein